MNLPMCGITTAYRPLVDALNPSKTAKSSLFGLIHFVAPSHPLAMVDGVPAIHLTAPILAGEAFACEVLQNASGGALISGKQGAINYRYNDDFLFGVISVDEPVDTDQTAMPAVAPPLQAATETAYRQMLTLIDRLGYPYLYRIWNYMADINGHSHGLERYRQFNIGRNNGLAASQHDGGDDLPAACALGLANGPLRLAFLVGRIAATAIENPRQMSAYDYPADYGPRPPSFSRGTLLNTQYAHLLFISGTASIVGHQTRHPLDVSAQTQETLANIEAVIQAANRRLDAPKLSLQQAVLRVYVRHQADMPAVRAAIARHGHAMRAIYIQAAICRTELLLEIEVTLQAAISSLCID